MNEIKALFESQIKIDDSDPGICWEWQGNKQLSGYGRISFCGHNFLAHRFAYQIYKGNIKNGLCILHQCNNPNCVNPEHLYQGTAQDNCRDLLLKRIKANKNKQNYKTKGLLEENEKKIIKEILHKNNYSRIGTAAELGISTTTLWRKLVKYNLLFHFEKIEPHLKNS